MAKKVLAYDTGTGRHVVPAEGDVVEGSTLISADAGNLLKVGSDGGLHAVASESDITLGNFDFMFSSENQTTRSLGKVAIPKTGLYTYSATFGVRVPDGVTQLQFYIAVPNALKERGGFRINTGRSSSSADKAHFAEPPFDQISINQNIFYSGYAVSVAYFNNFDRVSLDGTYLIDCNVLTSSGTAQSRNYECKIYMLGLGMVDGKLRQVVREANFTIEVSP